jgi:hypothetical protein
MTDEQWTEFNALDAGDFRERVKKDFGLDLELRCGEIPGGLAAAAD